MFGRTSDYLVREWPYNKYLILLIVHAALGVTIRHNPVAATAHALLVGLFAFYVAVRDPSPARLYMMMGYVVGCEVLWRMSRAEVFWMYTQYLVILLSVISMLRFGRGKPGIPYALMYLAVLIPSIPQTFVTMKYEIIRKELAFNLAGPFAFGLGVYAASKVSIARSAVGKILAVAVLPVLSVAVVATEGALAGQIVFTHNSSYAASGGYAPNQVSVLMSFGTVILFTMTVIRGEFSRYKLLVGVMMLYFIGQGLLTFSRGGTLNTIAFIVISMPFMLGDRKSRRRFILLAAVVTPVVILYLLPKLEDTTQGAIEERYTMTSTTGRWELIEAEWRIFQEHPFLGVGPGRSRFMRGSQFRLGYAASHTEYSRLLAEHGIAGIMAMLFMLLTFGRMRRSATTYRDKGLVLAAMAWTLVMFTHAATRTMTFAFLAIGILLWVQSTDQAENQQGKSVEQ